MKAKRIGRMRMPRWVVLAMALVVSASIARAQGFTNSVGMKMVPVPGTKILMGTTEVTVDQYRAAGLGYEAPEFAQSGNHPAVNVSWNDAKKYCAWLSKKEGKKYRLPSDREWSCAVGIGNLESVGGSPESKCEKLPDVFPWGSGKPSGRAGNYMGQEWKSSSAGIAYAKSKGWKEGQLCLVPDYNDGHMFTAPVGSYSPNSLGIYDLGGNVWEWCEDKYGGSGAAKAYRVMRGGAWGGGDICGLLSSCRDHVNPEYRGGSYGFRVVCEA